MESRGFYFEGAEASVELMLRRAQTGYRPPFELIDFLIVVENRQGRGLLAEANVKIRVRNGGEEIAHTAAEGDGPVNALDVAIRKALLSFYPQLGEVQLVDYKVRVLNEDGGTGANVRVSIESSDGHRTWSTVGSSSNIIEASWLALADSLEYPLLKDGSGGQSESPANRANSGVPQAR
jgi:2-isopropylmalate synthase